MIFYTDTSRPCSLTLDDDDALGGDLRADPVQATGDGGERDEAVELSADADGLGQGQLLFCFGKGGTIRFCETNEFMWRRCYPPPPPLTSSSSTRSARARSRASSRSLMAACCVKKNE